MQSFKIDENSSYQIEVFHRCSESVSLRLIINHICNNYKWDIDNNRLELFIGDTMLSIPLPFNIIADLPTTEEYQKTEWVLFSVEFLENYIYITAINKDIWDEHVR